MRRRRKISVEKHIKRLLRAIGTQHRMLYRALFYHINFIKRICN